MKFGDRLEALSLLHPSEEQIICTKNLWLVARYSDFHIYVITWLQKSVGNIFKKQNCFVLSLSWLQSLDLELPKMVLNMLSN